MKANATKEKSLVASLSKGVDDASNYFAHRKGLLPMIGIALILLNFLLASLLPADWFIIRTNLILHLGLIVAILGQMLTRVL